MKLPGRRVLISFLLLSRLAGAGTEGVDDLVQQQKFTEALGLIRRSLGKAVSQERTHLLLSQADCLVQLRLQKDAREVLDQIDPRTAPASFFRIRGQWQRQEQENDLARKDFAQALKLSTDPSERITVLCELSRLESEAEHREASESYWSQAVETASAHNLETKLWDPVYRTRFRILTESQRTQDALDLARLARAHYQAANHPSGVFWSLLAEITTLKNMGRFADAERVWRQALDMPSRYRAAALLMWGYRVLFEVDDTPALRRILVECEANWSQQWTEYERYHVRMLQALIWLYGLGDPARAMTYLRMAEPLASPVARPAGDHMSVTLSFHEFGDGPSSDVEQVLWLQLGCLKKLGQTVPEKQEFMLAKVTSLPAQERPAWYFKLATTYLPSNPEEAKKYFDLAMADASLKVQSHLQRAMMDAYLDAGMVVPARALALELRERFDHLDSHESLDLLRNLLSQNLKLAWVESLWTGSLESEAESLHAAVQDELLNSPERMARLEAAELEQEREHRASGLVSLRIQDLRSKAERLLAQNRVEEAVAACQVGRDICEQAGKSTASFDKLISYGLFRLGRREAALETVDSARKAFAGSVRMDSSPEETECATLQVAYLLELQRAQPALELADQYLSRADTVERAGLLFARARALAELGRHEEALEAFDTCEAEVDGSLYAVGVKCRRAMLFDSMDRRGPALQELRAALSLAQEQHSVRQRDVVLLWHDLEPKSAPVKETAKRVDTLLTELPPEYAERLKSQNSTRYLMTLAGLDPGPKAAESREWLTRSEFLQQISEIMSAEPNLAVSVPLLPASLAQRQATLPTGEVLVEYYLGARQTVIMLAAPEGFVLRRLEVDRATLEQWIAQTQSDPSAAENLYRLLVTPIEDACNRRTMVLLGHGPLLSLPWDLLRAADGSLLVQNHAWKLWAGDGKARSQPLPASPRIVAVGDVVGAELPGSRREVETLSRIGYGQVELLQGAEATSTELRKRLSVSHIVHLATHSTRSYIQLSDGNLPINELYSLPLNPGAVVVLSSCEGANPGEQARGPVTLAAAFLVAGASQVIASLDRVQDGEAEALFAAFYRALAQGQSVDQALRVAKLQRFAANPKGDWWKFVVLGD